MGDPLGGSDTERWHFNRGIPIMFMVSMAIYAATQIAVGAWFASGMVSRIDALERAMIQTAPQGERLTRMEEKFEAMKTGIADIKAILQAPKR